jgi:uncharacterized protein DUF4062
VLHPDPAGRAENGGVKVLISSVRSGYQPYRDVVRAAVESRGHSVIDAGPTAGGEPEQADLEGVRNADLVVLLIGAEYGAFQKSGLSAPHEEFREARGTVPVLVFVESGVHRGATQQAFLDEVLPAASAHDSFTDPDRLRALVLRGIYRYALAMSAYAVDEEPLLARARNMLVPRQRAPEGPTLLLAVAGSPYQTLLGPDGLESRELARDVQREAMFGKYPILAESAATSVSVRAGELLIAQPGASVVLSGCGDLRLARSLKPAAGQAEIEALIEEDIVAGLAQLVCFADWLLDRLDPVRRLTDLALVCEIAGAAAMPWRTRAEQAANPRQGAMGSGTHSVTAVPHPPHRHRQALATDADRLAEDLATQLRREFRTLNARAAAAPAPERTSLLRRLLRRLWRGAR